MGLLIMQMFTKLPELKREGLLNLETIMEAPPKIPTTTQQTGPKSKNAAMALQENSFRMIIY
jgi:hypothetical protein